MPRRRASRPQLHTLITLGTLSIGAFAALFFLPLSPSTRPTTSFQPLSRVMLSQAQASGDRPLYGWAWSNSSTGGVGWISFNCANPEVNSCATAPYSVILKADNTLTGYAWVNPRDGSANSNNIGWLQFGGLSGCPGGGSCTAQLSGTTLTGWARFVTATNASSAGWDGWVKLSGTATNGSAYGVTMNTTTGAFSGYAWGGETVGWIDFNPRLNGVTPPPQCQDPQHIGVCDQEHSTNLATSCSASPSGPLTLTDASPTVSVTWTATAPSTGTPPYTYTWSGDASGSGLSTNPIVYSSGGVKQATVNVSDSASRSGANSCSVTINDNRTPSTPGGPGTLEVVGGYGVVVIRNQVAGKPASSVVSGSATNELAAKIINNGSAPVAGVRIVSIISQKDGTSLSSITTPSCLWSTNANGPFQSCATATLDLSNASGSNVAYFRIQIPDALKAVADSNPYTVTIGGATTSYTDGTGATVTANVNPVTLLFDYKVTTFNPF